MKHVRIFNLNEDNGLDSSNPQLLVLNLLKGLTVGRYKGKIIPDNNLPPFIIGAESEKKVEDVDIEIEGTDLNLRFNVYWSYEIKAGVSSPKPWELPDDPHEVTLKDMDVNRILLYQGETEIEITITPEITKLAVSYLEDFPDVDEIDL